MDEADMKDKIDSGELILVSKINGKSVVWSRFSVIVKAEATKEIGFVQCRDC